jgi:hypothetical protein
VFSFCFAPLQGGRGAKKERTVGWQARDYFFPADPKFIFMNVKPTVDIECL